MSTYQKDYAACKHIKRKEPDFTLNQELTDYISKNYRTMPLFEESLFTNVYTKLYSLQTNELLRCRWQQYKNVTGRVYSPFQFLDSRDFHFYLNECCFKPSETIHKRLHFRNRLRPGPGVDFRGQIPTPQELHMKRLGDDSVKRKYPKKYSKDSKDAKQEEKNQ